jgi:Tol biopolymer transport system component
LVAYEALALEGGYRNVYVRDIVSGQTNLASVAIFGSAVNGDSFEPQLSGDGRYVVFTSTASNLVSDDTNGVSDVFVRDRLLGVTHAVSHAIAGSSPASHASGQPVLGANGRTVVFASFATDIVPGDFNLNRDLFVLQLGGADLDADQIDDNWEMAYFGDLSRDGTGDFDGDGQSDRQEFLAATDPTNQQSVFTVFSITAGNGGAVTLVWAAVPGRIYQLQSRARLDDAIWSNMENPVAANAATAFKTISEPRANAFYRVVRLP